MDDPSDGQRGVTLSAAKWLVIIQSDNISAAQRAEFVDWLRESPLHIAKMLEMSQLHRNLASFKGWTELSRIDKAPVKTLFALFDRQRKDPIRLRRLRTRYLPSIAAGIAVILVLAVPFLNYMGGDEYRTQAGERREITLSDGSIMDLAPASEVTVKYRQSERLIMLNSGKALFHVAKNPDRPFVVQVLATQIRAIGTIFNVDKGVKDVSVTVVEGRVAVTQQTSTRSGRSVDGITAPTVSLGADEQMSITPDGLPSKVHTIASHADLGPAADQIIFDNETVAEVVRRFNAHNQTKIEIVDLQLGARRVSGIFQATDPRSFVAFIQAATSADVFSRDATHIVIGVKANTVP